MNYVEYITSSLAKGTIGANISVGIFALIGLCAVLGMYYGAVRGFSKSVIRLFVVGAAAVCAFLCVSAISNVIVTTATGNDGEVETVYLMSGSYDLCVIVKGKTFQEVAMFVAKELATMDCVTSTATHFVLRRYKELDVELIETEKDDRGAYSL